MTVTASDVELVKHHGLGNDFLIALAPDRPLGADEARSWCDRHTGFGADGLLVSEPVGGDVTSTKWSMVLWNADGGRAEISGNGLRCLGHAISMRQVAADVTAGEFNLTVDTDAGSRTLRVQPTDGPTWNVKASMGLGRSGPAIARGWEQTGHSPEHQMAVDIGNPHLVAFFPTLDGIDISTVGPRIEAEFPGGMNVHCVQVTGPHSLDLIVWERGVGVTQACGSGACAAAWAAHRLNLADTEIAVTMPGGSATVELSDDDIHLIGPSTYIGRVLVG